MTNSERKRIAIDAHCADEEFEKSILTDYGVTIVDRKDEPWTIIFEGTPPNLLKMLQDHWESSHDEASLAAMYLSD